MLTSKYRRLQKVAFVQLAVKFWNFSVAQIIYCALDKTYHLLAVLLAY